jgi:hypothetical protein
LFVVRDDERDIVAAVGADIRNNDRNLRARGGGENAWRGRAVGRRDRDTGDATRDRVLRILKLRLSAIVRVERRVGEALLLGYRLDAVREIPPKGQIEARGQIDDFLRVGGARGRGEAHCCCGERRYDGYKTSTTELHLLPSQFAGLSRR